MALQLSLYQYAALGTLLLAVYFTLSIYSLTLYILALASGYFVAPFLLKQENIDAFQDILFTYFELSETPKVETTKPAAPIVLRKNRTASSASTNVNVNVPPWETLEVSSRINDAAEELILLIVDNYINKWYKAEISADNAFVGEIQYQIRHAASLILRESKDFDISSFVLEDWLPLILIHIDRICRHVRKNGKESTPASLIEIEILQEMPDLHIAMTSRENEIDYLRVVADFLVERLVDETRVGGKAEDPDDAEAAELLPTKKIKQNRPWPSQCVRHFLRELVLSTILIPLLDFVSNPDTLNNILLGALEPSKNNIPKVDTREIKSKFLAKLTECNQSDTPDSLIVLKLSEVIREPRLLQLFYMYLHDIKGPAHFIDCFLQAHDLHNSIHKLKESQKVNEETHSDAWTLYSDYIHESAPRRIRFENEQIPEDFHVAVDSKDAILMKKVAEEVYKEMYHRLNYQYLIPFCQSECYLGYLCGAPPDVVELIRGPKEDEKLNEHRPPTESSFSLSQFRNKLLNAFSSQISMEEDSNGEEVEIQEEDKSDAIGSADIVLADTEKDLNKWIITVPTVEPRKDISGRAYFVYVIQNERLDISNGETSSLNSDSADFPSTWTITRKYDEFHILEKKLQEFYGSSIKFGILPDKRALQQKNPTFMDTQRLQFEKFLQGLALQPALKKSELLYAFLTTDEELREDLSLTSDLNPFNVMRKVPGKLQREKGQNLKPFLLNVMANILAPSSFYAESPTMAREATSDQSSLKSFDSEVSLPHQYPSKIALDNLLLTQKAASDAAQGITQSCEPRPQWTRETSKIFTFFILQIGYGISDFFIATFILFQKFFDRIFTAFIKKQVQKLLDKILQEETILYLIQSFQNMLLTHSNIATDEEKKLRAELTQRRLDQYLDDTIPGMAKEIIGTKNFRQIASDVVKALQLPRLNKQLAFVLLDALIEKIRNDPDLQNSNIPV